MKLRVLLVYPNFCNSNSMQLQITLVTSFHRALVHPRSHSMMQPENKRYKNGMRSSNPTTSFPTDDPWVTSVGGTSLNREGTAFQESVWNGSGGASGGGFSIFF